MENKIYCGSDINAKCRGCGKELTGKPYFTGNLYAFNPKTGEEAKINYYGGFVCSEKCDRNACARLEGSMPGHKYGEMLSSFATTSLSRNWGV